MSHSTMLDRIRSEYLETPGLCLTLEQAQRLFHLQPRVCREVLDALIDMHFLCLTEKGGYARSSAAADALSRLHTVRTWQLKAQIDRRQRPTRRLGLDTAGPLSPRVTDLG